MIERGVLAKDITIAIIQTCGTNMDISSEDSMNETVKTVTDLYQKIDEAFKPSLPERQLTPLRSIFPSRK
ncbi:MAG: hypothetical protein HQ553_04590 [Chloroflexi bacterium]|nr:hypothetical protein [Chloroflexota bacterium]